MINETNQNPKHPEKQTSNTLKEKETIKCGRRTVLVGEILKSGGIFELFYKPDNEAAQKASSLIMSKVAQVARAEKLNIANNKNGFKALIHNEQDDVYICLEVGQIIQDYKSDNINRKVKIYLSDGSEIEVNNSYTPQGKNKAELTTPSMLHITPISHDINIQFHRGSMLRIYGRKREEVEQFSSLLKLTQEVINKISGRLKNPYEILYGDCSETELIRIVLGDEVIIDSKSGVVLKNIKEKPPGIYGKKIIEATKLDYKKTLEMATEQLRTEVWDQFYTLAYRLKNN